MQVPEIDQQAGVFGRDMAPPKEAGCRQPFVTLQGMLDRDALLNSLAVLRRHSRPSGRAPYKPLTMLWALGRIWADQTASRLVPFEEIRAGVKPLLLQFGGPTGSSTNPVNPIWRLQFDADGALWECRTTRPAIVSPEGSPSVGELIATEAHFGLSAPLFVMLVSDSILRLEAGYVLAEQVCPPTLWPELFEATGIPFEDSGSPVVLPITATRTRSISSRLSRDPRFRTAVLEAYGRRCAVCGTSPQLGATRFGVEAAHIRWVTENGPDAISNGLALCVMHHRGLDRGAFTLHEDLRVRVSPRLIRPDDDVGDHFWRFDGQCLGLPDRKDDRPLREHVDWHRREVFAAG